MEHDREEDSRKPKIYRAQVLKDGKWFIAKVSGLRLFTGGRGGVVTQGRDLDELAFMVRDVMDLMTDEKDFGIQLLTPSSLKLSGWRSGTALPTKRNEKAT